MTEYEIKHGWYSKLQQEVKKNIIYKSDRKGTLSNIYLTDEGIEVEVTEICKEKDDFNIKSFPDAIYKGKVIKWIKSIY